MKILVKMKYYKKIIILVKDWNNSLSFCNLKLTLMNCKPANNYIIKPLETMGNTLNSNKVLGSVPKTPRKKYIGSLIKFFISFSIPAKGNWAKM